MCMCEGCTVYSYVILLGIAGTLQRVFEQGRRSGGVVVKERQSSVSLFCVKLNPGKL